MSGWTRGRNATVARTTISPDGNRLTITSRVVTAMVVGAMLMFGGVWFILMPVLASEASAHEHAPLVWRLIVGIACGAIGVPLLFSRRGVSVFLPDRTVRTWLKVIAPLGKRSRPLDAASMATVAREVRIAHHRRTGTKKHVVFPVRVHVSGERILVSEGSDMREGRRLARLIARFARIGLEDTAGGRKITQGPAGFDASPE